MSDEVLIPDVFSFSVEENPHHPNSGNQRLRVKCDRTGSISDGYHTFDELYQHRCLLFCALLKYREDAYKSKLHHDGSEFEGWFIAGTMLHDKQLNDKQVTYHLPLSMWDLCPAKEVERAPEWDGHTSQDVLKRLTDFIWSLYK